MGYAQPTFATANHARLDLQRLYDYHFGTSCDLLASTTCKMLLAELGLLPLQVFWWQQSLHIWNSLAALPAGSFVREILVTDNLTDAFVGVLAVWLALWQVACIRLVIVCVM